MLLMVGYYQLLSGGRLANKMVSFYRQINALIDYLEQHLEDKLDYQVLARQFGLSTTTLRRVFPLFTGINLSDYLRRRRLTLAGRDLAQTNLRVIDAAMKYGYDSTAAFSRAFEKFHGIKPSVVRNQYSQLTYFPKITLSLPEPDFPVRYEIIEQPAFTLYGYKKKTDEFHIKTDAPALFDEITEFHPDLPRPDYGMVEYHAGRDTSYDYDYWVLWPEPHPNTFAYKIPQSRWLKFIIPTQKAPDIQASTDYFYYKFLPTCDYRLKPDPDLEYYHDGITEFLVPIK